MKKAGEKPGKPNDVDEWGEPLHMSECFKCGTYYCETDSTAPQEYMGTYCSNECYSRDLASMRVAAGVAGKFKLKVPKP